MSHINLHDYMNVGMVVLCGAYNLLNLSKIVFFAYSITHAACLRMKCHCLLGIVDIRVLSLM